MQFSIAQLSRVGGRNKNEDRAAYTRSDESLLLVVADGMGGHLHGDLAAHAAVSALTGAFQREARPRLADPAAFLERVLLAAHYDILDLALEAQMPDVPGTTCVACVVQAGAAWWGHAGDSRLYFVRAGRVLTRTRDHSLTRQIADLEGLSDEEANALPGRNVIYNCLGGYRRPEVDLSLPLPLESGDTLLLCSDGLWGPLADEEIADAFRDPAPGRVLARLVDSAEARAGAHSDNLTGLAVVWGREDPAGAPALPGHTVIAGV